MKHCCHCGLKHQLKNFKAGKLGLLGGILIIGHLLFHVAECLVLPALIVAFSHQDAEATAELSSPELPETNLPLSLPAPTALHCDFYATLESYHPLRP